MNNDMTLLQVESALVDSGFREVILRRSYSVDWEVTGVPLRWRTEGARPIAVVGVGQTLCEALTAMMNRADLEFGPVTK